MNKQAPSIVLIVFLSIAIFFSNYVSATTPCNLTNVHTIQNNIPPRLQWNHNSGYCGEVSLISAGLYYGQYISQYDARAIATKNAPQNRSQLLLGLNDQYAASKMHLQSIEWNNKGKNSHQFLSWIKQNVVQGYPVAIGIYTNEYLFYNNTDPDAGDPDYDHIVPVIAISSLHSLNDSHYYPDDVIYFSDNGLWSDPKPLYIFHYTFNTFQANRIEANAKKGFVYSLPDATKNYGIAITGVKDLNKETFPVCIATNVNYEKPEIKNGSNTRPAARPIILTITVSDLEPGVLYNLYRYNNLSSVPDSNFNAAASKAYEHWPIQIGFGDTYTMTQIINSDEMAIYRAVKATAP